MEQALIKSLLLPNAEYRGRATIVNQNYQLSPVLFTIDSTYLIKIVTNESLTTTVKIGINASNTYMKDNLGNFAFSTNEEYIILYTPQVVYSNLKYIGFSNPNNVNIAIDIFELQISNFLEDEDDSYMYADSFERQQTCIHHDNFMHSMIRNSLGEIVISDSSLLFDNRYSTHSLSTSKIGNRINPTMFSIVLEEMQDNERIFVKEGFNGYVENETIPDETKYKICLLRNNNLNTYQKEFRLLNNISLQSAFFVEFAYIDFIRCINGEETAYTITGKNVLRYYAVFSSVRIYHNQSNVVKIYLDDFVWARFKCRIDPSKKIGIMMRANMSYCYRMFNVYNLTSFRLYDASKSIDQGRTETHILMTSPERELIDQFPNSWINGKAPNNRGLKNYIQEFQIDYANRPQAGNTNVHDWFRSEVCFVPHNQSNLKKWKLSFDVYIPTGYFVSEDNVIIFQRRNIVDNDGYDNGVGSAPMAINIVDNNKIKLYCPSMDHCKYVKKGDSDINTNVRCLINNHIIDFESNKWYHFDVVCKEGYLVAHNPYIKIYVDGKLEIHYRGPNCYNVLEAAHLKYGIYYRQWEKLGEPPGFLQKRIFFDNVKLEM